MKKLFGGLVLASAFILTACGGGKSESSHPQTPPKKNLADASKQNSADAGTENCISDKKAKTITGIKGKVCEYKNPEKKLTLTLDCTVANKLQAGGVVGEGFLKITKEKQEYNNPTGKMKEFGNYSLACPV